MTKIEFKDQAIESQLRRSIGHGSPFLEDELASVCGTFRVHFCRRLEEGLRYLKNVTYFRLNYGNFTDVSGLQKIPDWPDIQIARTNLDNLHWLKGHSGLEMLIADFGFIEDISPLLDLPNLKLVQLQGNPLSEESYYEVLPELEERVNVVDYSEEPIWKLQRRMWEAGHRASYHKSWAHKYGTLVVPELFDEVDRDKFDRNKRWAIEGKLKPDQLREELDKPEPDIAEIARRYWTPPYRRRDFVDRGGAERAREWIEASEVDDSIADALKAFVDRAPEAGFVREKTEVSRRRYSHYYQPLDDDPRRLPMWYRHVREALAFPELKGKSAVGIFCEDTDRVPEPLAGAPVDLEHIGPGGRNAKIALYHRHWLYPIGYAGRELEYALCIELDAEEPGPVRVVALDQALRWSFDPDKAPSFAGLGAMFEAIESVEPRASALSEEAAEREEPPPVTYTGPSHERFDSQTMRERIQASDLDEPLRASLTGLVDDFPELEWTAEYPEEIEYWEVRNLERFPDWYRQLRGVMSAFSLPGEGSAGTYVEFRDRGLDEDYQIFWPTLTESSHREYYLLRHRLLQIGSGTYDLLFIRLDGADRGVYSYDIEMGTDLDLNLPNIRVYDDIADMYDDIVAVTDGADARLER